MTLHPRHCSPKTAHSIQVNFIDISNLKNLQSFKPIQSEGFNLIYCVAKCGPLKQQPHSEGTSANGDVAI